MITQEDIDAMEDGMGLVDRLRGACSGHPHATIAWPHRVLHEAAARIEQLERELAQRVDQVVRISEGWAIADEQLKEALKERDTEKAMSDRLAASYAMSLNDKAKVKACPSLAAYRKARGL